MRRLTRAILPELVETSVELVHAPEGVARPAVRGGRGGSSRIRALTGRPSARGSRPSARGGSSWRASSRAEPALMRWCSSLVVPGLGPGVVTRGPTSGPRCVWAAALRLGPHPGPRRFGPSPRRAAGRGGRRLRRCLPRGPAWRGVRSGPGESGVGGRGHGEVRLERVDHPPRGGSASCHEADPLSRSPSGCASVVLRDGVLEHRHPLLD